MTENIEIVQAIPVNRIFLNNTNPRFEPVHTEDEAIKQLCAAEDVYALADDIVKQGRINPMERLALVPIETSEKERRTYIVAEGNRRICALKLLDDPDRAPTTALKKKFKDLSGRWTPIDTVPAAIFDSFSDVEIWLSRMHNGPQGGVGRKNWDSDQKQRFFGTNKNKAALEILDYAEARGFISKDQRKGKLTTVQRFVSKEGFRENIGLDKSDPTIVNITRERDEFDTVLGQFISDLIDGEKVHSRMNKDAINAYARSLTSDLNASAKRITPQPITLPPAKTKKRRKPRKPAPPAKVTNIEYNPDIHAALKDLGNHKLQSLYRSLHEISLDGNTPILSVGAWSFLESLTSYAGYTNNDFSAYYSKNKVKTNYGMSEGEFTATRGALSRVSVYGNTTKHDGQGALFDGQQLNNDMLVLGKVILHTIEEIKKRT